MIKSGSATSILWLAHVLPLYVIRFKLTPTEALNLLGSLRLGDWVSSSSAPDKKERTIRDMVKGINPRFFKPWVIQLGTVSMNAYDVPELS
jgi:hypothetical protein